MLTHASRQLPSWLIFDVGQEMTKSSEFLTAVGFAFEKRRGVTLGAYELATIADAGLADADCDRLADSIWTSLEEEQEEAYRVSAYWALGKRYRQSDLQKFVASLRRELPKSSRAVYQILIALESYGAAVFDQNRRGRSIEEEALNRADALAYLRRIT